MADSGVHFRQAPRPRQKRVRTGCLRCRVRRRKCDEGKPRCRNCVDKGFECRYGAQLTFLSKNARGISPTRAPPTPALSASYTTLQFVTEEPAEKVQSFSRPLGQPEVSNRRHDACAQLAERDATLHDSELDVEDDDAHPYLLRHSGPRVHHRDDDDDGPLWISSDSTAQDSQFRFAPGQPSEPPGSSHSNGTEYALQGLLALGATNPDHGNGDGLVLDTPTSVGNSDLQAGTPSGPDVGRRYTSCSVSQSPAEVSSAIPAMVNMLPLGDPSKRRRLEHSTGHDFPFSEPSPASGILSTPGTVSVTADDPSSPLYHLGPAPTTGGLGDLFLDSLDPLLFSTPNWILDEFAHDPGYLASREELRTLIFSSAQSAAPTREVSPAADDVAGGPAATPSAQLQMSQVLLVGRRLEYLKNYVGQVAPWLDMFDSDRTFGIQLPALARHSPALLYAILALSARQMERKGAEKGSFESLELYQAAIRLLTPMLQARGAQVIAICVILCCMEMMSASGQDWRRHLEGCAALFDAFGVNGFSGGLLQAVFWCYARMDLCGALISDGMQGTLLQPSKWLPSNVAHAESRSLFSASRNPDMHANNAVYLCAQVCELICDRTRFVELGESNGCTQASYATRWQQLWEDLQNWLSSRPQDLMPVQTLDAKPFPHIFFVHWAAISSNQLHHTACIILLSTMPKALKLPRAPSSSAVWHAKRICGISLTNPHQGCLNNAIQPLWIAGRLLSHKAEHAVIVKLIRSIEAMTGWGTCWRISDLEEAWGYQVHGSRGAAARPH